MKVERIFTDKNGNIDTVSEQGMKVWLDTYDKMIANGKTKEEAKAAADNVQEKMDAICFDGYILSDDKEN